MTKKHNLADGCNYECPASRFCASVCHRSVSADPNENILSSDRCWWQESTNLASSRHVLLHVLWQAVMCLHRIMHWARRIEQEIDRVFQHITGAQQLKGVSTSLCSIEISLMSVLDQPIKTRQAESRTSAKPWSRRAVHACCQKQLAYFWTS